MYTHPFNLAPGLFALMPFPSQEPSPLLSLFDHSAETDHNYTGKNDKGGIQADPAERLAKKKNADQDPNYHTDLSHWHGIANRGKVKAITERNERQHHHRTAAENQRPVFTKFSRNMPAIN
jgi:hypothetical protein